MERVRGATLEEVGAREYFPISLFCILRRAQPRSARALEVQFIDNTERKDQRGKEKQKESLYNLEFRSFFELKNIGTAISRQEQIRNDSQAVLEGGAPRGVFQGRDGALGKKRRANGGCLGYPEARKDVVSCEKARGTANRF